MTAKLIAVTTVRRRDRNRTSAACATSTTIDEEKERDAGRGERLELAVAVRMIRVGRLAREPQADERHDIRGGVGQRMEPVRQDADRSARWP